MTNDAMASTSLKLIGAGLPRTGTTSLKEMVERLLGGRCYHMKELYQRPEADGPKWMAALDGDADQLDAVLDGWVAALDWPASVLWKELSERHPDALVVLSHRGSSDVWWSSADATVWQVMRDIRAGNSKEHVNGIHRLMRERAGFSEDLGDEAQARADYDRHFADVIARIPAERLLVWQPEDGWEPLCDRLGVSLPNELPAHANSRTDFRDRHGVRGC